LVINLVERQHKKRRITKREGDKANENEKKNNKKRKKVEKTRKEEKKMSKRREMLMATITTSMEPKP